MIPEIDVLGLSLKTFGLSLAFAFLCSGALVARRLREEGQPSDWAYEIVFAAAVGGLVGSRLYWVVQHYDEARGHLLSSLFSGAGLVFYGGLLGGALAVVLVARRRGLVGLALLDLGAPGIAIGYAVGRIGCQLSGDGDYGIASSLPWAMAYPHGTVPTTVAVHPTPIYETVVMGLVTYGLWRMRGRLRPGLLFAAYLLLGGLERFLVEFIRRNDAVLAGLTSAQLESLGMIIAGGLWFALAARGGLRRRSTAQLTPA